MVQQFGGKNVWKCLTEFNKNLLYDSLVSILGTHQREIKTYNNKILYKNVNRSFIRSYWALQNIQWPFPQECLNKFKYIYTMEFSLATYTEWTTGMCKNMAESHKYVQWKNPHTKDYKTYDSINKMFQSRQNSSIIIGIRIMVAYSLV